MVTNNEVYLTTEIARLEQELIKANQLNTGMTHLLAAILVERGGSISIDKTTIINLDNNLYVVQTENKDTGSFTFELQYGE